MALPLRPRPLADRPQSVLPSPGPANDNRREARDRTSFGRGLHGRLQGHGFRFASPAAEEQWIRDAYQAGINADTWHLGDEIDSRTAELALAGLGGPMPAVYLGPDGNYRTINPRTIEAAAVRDHRNKHLTGKTIDQIATAGRMPGEEEWIAQWRASRAANDNALSRGSGGEKEEPTSEDKGGGRPDLGTRFAASARRAVVDDTVFGNALQQFASGHAVSPDVLAARPSDRFLQLGSKGMLEWHRMFEPLGIAGGKRRIDFLSPQERKRWETVWEALPADQQAAYRAMWEEKQKDYRPWREKFERETALPPPETVAEFATDIAGSISGSMASPESWIGFTPTASANAVRMAAVNIAEAAARASGVVGVKRASQAFIKGVDDAVSDNAAGALRGETARTRELLDNAPNLEKKSQLQKAGDGLLDEVATKPIDLRAKLKEAKKKVYTLKEAYGLGEPHEGLLYVREKATGTPESIEFMKSHPDVIWFEATQEFGVPALRYKNPNPNGKNLIRLDIGSVFGDQVDIVLTDTKTQMAIWGKATQSKARYTLTRLKFALEQNPGYRIVYEFKTHRAAEAARNFLAENNFSDIVVVKVRGE